jgi:deoxycytidylate deaminase
VNILQEVIKVAKQSGCNDARCGSIIIKDGIIIGKGFNSPPGNIESQRRCHIKKDAYHKKISDKTCCVHAEERAIMNALRNNPDKLKGSTLYFIRINEKDEPQNAGKPFCTICSKFALDAGIKGFALYYGEFKIYNTEEYNNLSYEYND